MDQRIKVNLYIPENLEIWLEDNVPSTIDVKMLELLAKANEQTSGPRFSWQSFQTIVSKVRRFEVCRGGGRALRVRRR